MATIRKMLDISTAHLPARFFAPETCVEAWENVGGVHPTEYGVIVWVPDDVENGEMPDTPEEVTAIRRYARALDCDYIMLDCDAEQLADLPSWEW
jgi:hypothetical protein